MRLKVQFYLAFLTIIFAVVVAIGVGTPILVKDYLIENRKTELTEKGKDFVRIVRDWQEGRINYWQFGRLLDNLDRLFGARIWVLDDQNYILFASEEFLSPEEEADRPNRVHSPITPPPLPSVVPPVNPADPSQSVTASYNQLKSLPQGGIPRLAITEVPGGEELLRVLKNSTETNRYFPNHPYYQEDMLVVKVPYQSTHATEGGMIIFHLPVASIDKIIKSLYIYLGLAAAMVGGFALLLALLLSSKISRPLFRMKTSAAEMAQGNYDVHIPLNGPNEVQELALSINSLARDLKRTMTEIEKQERLRRDFIANVSHELRTPLTIMRGFTEALLDGVITEPKRVNETYQTMRDETLRLNGLISELLDLSRLQTPTTHFELSKLDLAEVLTNSAMLLEQACLDKGIDLVINLPDDHFMISGNGDRLTQLLLILLDNAVKFTPSGGTIRIALSSNASTHLLEVADTGSGISEEDLPFVWERFYKSDKSRQRSGQAGTGLGLAIAKEIVEKHCAKVDIQSTCGIGTTFKIEFPQYQENNN